MHITLPYTSSAVSQAAVRVHRSRAHRHILVVVDPPRTSRADTAIDVAVAEPDARRVRAGDVVVTRATAPARVRDPSAGH